MSVGENFRFGKKAKGDAEMLASRSEFETTVVPLVEVDGETVSSTRIRALLAAGEIERRPAPAWGRQFMIEGEVVQRRPPGPHPRLPDGEPGPRGQLGFPVTASTRPSPTGNPAAVNVGVRPTFETGRGVLIETYMIDHEEDLYGKTSASLRQAAAGREALRRHRELIAQMQPRRQTGEEMFVRASSEARHPYGMG